MELLFGAVAFVGACTDYRSGKIYNWLTLPALGLGLVMAAFGGWTSVSAALGGLGLATVLFLPLFFTGILGGGDVKLIMALSTVLGARGTMDLTVGSFAIAGLGAFILLILHRRAGYFFKELAKFFRSLVTPGLVVQWPKLSREIRAPFGPAIFAGMIYALVKARGLA